MTSRRSAGGSERPTLSPKVCAAVTTHRGATPGLLFCVNRPRLGLTAAETGWKKAAWAGGSGGDFDVAEVGWWL